MNESVISLVSEGVGQLVSGYVSEVVNSKNYCAVTEFIIQSFLLYHYFLVISLTGVIVLFSVPRLYEDHQVRNKIEQ